MINEPKVVIRYLVDYDINVTGTIDPLVSNPQNLTSADNLEGKKGLHLNGGYYDEATGEDVGTLLNGTYTLYDENHMYNGLVGTQMSNLNYTFDEDQYLIVSTVEPNTYIKSIFIYFDPVAGEIATKISISDNPSKIYTNNKYVFMHSFGEDSQLTSIRINFLEWSKRNATVKILKVKTGYTAIYDPYTIRSIYYTKDKFSDTSNLKFGVTMQEATIEINDYDGMITQLYNSDLIFKDVRVQLYIDNFLEATYMITKKSTNNTLDYWSFDCTDYPALRLSETINALNVELDNNNKPIPKSLKYIIEYIIGGVVPIVYGSVGLERELANTQVKTPYLVGGQTREQALTKCCQIGLLRMYSDEEGRLIITRGI